MAALGVVSLRNTPTPSGKRDSRYPDGDDGTPAIPLTWATIPSFTGKLEGTPFSVNVRDEYLTEPGSPDATITVEGALPSGWTFSDGETLAYSGTGAGQASIRFKAARSGFESFSNDLTVESLASGTADTTAPTKITGLVVALNGSNQPVLTFDAPSDPVVATEDRDGLATFTPKRGAVALTPVALTDDPGFSFASADIGTMSPAGSSVQDGADWQEGAEGSLPASTDEFRFTYATVSGDFIATVLVESMSGTLNAFSIASLQARVDLDQNSQYASVQQMYGTAGANGVIRGAYRLQKGGTRTAVGSSTVSLPSWIQLERQGDTFFTRQSSDGNTWTAIENLTVPMQAELKVGLATTSASQGNTISVQYRNLCITNQGRITYTDTGAGSGVTRSYTVFATDGADNDGAESASVSINIPSAPSADPPKRWRPGHYKYSTPPQHGGNPTQIPDYSLITSNANFKGAAVLYQWGLMETSRDVYSFSRIHRDRDAMAAAGKKFIIWAYQGRQDNLGHGVFWSSVNTNYVPAYLVSSEFANGWYPTNGGGSSKIYNANVMSRWIACIEALAEEFDDDSVIEAVILNSESVFSFGPGNPPASDYSDAQLQAQWLRMIDAAGAAFQKTNVYFAANFLGFGATSLLHPIFARCLEKKVGIFGPDHTASNGDGTAGIHAYGIHRGVDNYLGSGAGAPDYRGQIPRALRYGDHSVMGTSFAASTAVGQEDGDDLQGHHLNHHLWYSYSGAGVNQTFSAQVSAIAADPNHIETGAPSAYTQGVDTT
jgi:regulation of enolase protein 1 (concanavalin A-like superfamily)